MPRIMIADDAQFVWLRVNDEQDNLPLGRLTLTYSLDTAARYPLGYYLGFEPPSYLAALECLHHTIRPKPNVRGKYDTEHDWIAYGLPTSLVIDNGIPLQPSLRKTTWRKNTLMTPPLNLTPALTQAIQAPLIRYPRFNELHREIQRCQELSRLAGEPQCMALEGVPGAGKSTLVADFARAFPRFETETGTFFT